MDHSLVVLLISLFTWTSLYFVLCLLDSRRSYEWHCRMVTVIHASLIICLSFWAVFILGPNPFTDAGGKASPYQLFTMSVCLGYFIFDLSWCLYSRTEGGVMLLHHTMSISGISVSMYFGMYGTEMMVTMLGTEITNPLLQLRWFLKESGKGDGLLADVVDHLFVILFGIIRLFFGTILLYSYFHQPTDALGRLAAVCIYSIGWVFWISIMQFAIKKYKKKWKKVEVDGDSSSHEKLLEDEGVADAISEPPESEASSDNNVDKSSALKNRSVMGSIQSIKNVSPTLSTPNISCLNSLPSESCHTFANGFSSRLKSD